MRDKIWANDAHEVFGPPRLTNSRIVSLARVSCLVYFGLLASVLLAIGNTTKFVDVGEFVSLYSTIEPGLHIGLFACLAFLVSASRWPLHPLTQAIALVLYAGGSEAVQLWLPHRTPRWGCFVQDIVGLFFGFLAWLAIVDLSASVRRWKR